MVVIFVGVGVFLFWVVFVNIMSNGVMLELGFGEYVIGCVLKLM